MLTKNKANVIAPSANSKLTIDEILFFKYKNSNRKINDTEWYNKLKKAYVNGISNTFIVYGNIYDQAVPSWKIEEYIKEKIVSELNISEICTIDHQYLNNNLTPVKPNDIPVDFRNRLRYTIDTIRNNSSTKKALIVRHAEFVAPCGDMKNLNDDQVSVVVNLLDTANDTDFLCSDNMLIIITESIREVSSKLLSSSNGITAIEIPYPNQSERSEMIKYLRSSTKGVRMRDVTVEELSVATAGLGLDHIEGIWKSSLDKGFIDLIDVRNIKNQVLKKEFGDKLDILEPNEKHSLCNYGGMDYVKQYLREGVISPMIRGELSVVPKGLLFMGSPGTGKSYMAKCIASECGVSFAELKVSNFISKWVGESEQNLEKALMCVKSMSPCFLFIDEIDQVFQRGEEDSNGVRGNVFQIMMNFMGDPDNRGKVIVIGATNYPNRMDEALKRAGRFDTKLIFTPPLNEREVTDVVEAQLKRVDMPVAVEQYGFGFKRFVSKLENYSQAEIELVISKACNLARRKNEDALSVEYLLLATDYIKKADSDDIDEMISIAIKECNDLEFMPSEVVDKYTKKPMRRWI